MPFDDLRNTTKLIHEGIQTGLHLGVQAFVQYRGRVVVDRALGENAPGEALTRDHLMLWLSSGKPLTAAAVMLLAERTDLNLDRAVADFIPEFAAADKQGVTVRHLLTHTAGLKPIVTGWPQKSWDETIARICASGLQREWIPGERAAYDPARSWFILGEIIRRVSGQPVAEFVRSMICEPLGMQRSWMAMPPEVHENATLGMMYASKEGRLTPTAAHLAEACTNPSPGGSMRGPVAELGRFYAMLLRGGVTESGSQLLRHSTVEEMTRRQRQGMYDETFQHNIDFGLGLIVNSNHYGPDTVPYGFGRYSSEGAFGHGGAQSSIGFADPGHDLVVVLVANGCPGEVEHNRRFRELVSSLYEDLELAS